MPDQPQASGSQPLNPLPRQFEDGNADRPLELIIDHFPHGSPGTPIPGSIQFHFRHHNNSQFLASLTERTQLRVLHRVRS